MRRAYQVEAVRAAERALMDLLPDGVLMNRAAAGLAAVCGSLLARYPGHVYGARVVVLAGSGDNGGDALYAGARLARRGAAVTAIAAAPKVHAGGTADLLAAGGRVTDNKAAIARADLILDGLLGIGGRGGLREPFAGLAAAAEHARRNGPATVVAVDLPSGIDADTGAVDGPAVRADVTVTFGALKPGLLIDPGAGYAGTVELVDIGLRPEGQPAAEAPQRDDIAARLPRPGPESDKYRRGVVGVLAGSDRERARRGGPAGLARGGAHRAPRRRRLGPARIGGPGPGLGGRTGHGHRPGRRGPAGRGAGHRPARAGRRGRPDHPQPASGPAAAPRAHPDHPARGGTGPAARHRPGRRRGPPPGPRPPGRRTPRPHRPPQGLDHGRGVAGGDDRP